MITPPPPFFINWLEATKLFVIPTGRTLSLLLQLVIIFNLSEFFLVQETRSSILEPWPGGWTAKTQFYEAFFPSTSIDLPSILIELVQAEVETRSYKHIASKFSNCCNNV